MQDKDVTRAGFGPRAAAYLIDRALLLVALGILRTPFRIAALLGADQLTAKSFLFRFSAVDVVCWLAAAAYFVLLTYFTGGTLGKKILKLRVQKEDGAPLRFIDVLYRETVGRFLSGILCIGYLMVLVDKKSRGFHDWLCDTCVVYDGVTFRTRTAEAAGTGDAQAAPLWSQPGTAYSRPGAESVPAEEPGAELPEPPEEHDTEEP